MIERPRTSTKWTLRSYCFVGLFHYILFCSLSLLFSLSFCLVILCYFLGCSVLFCCTWVFSVLCHSVLWLCRVLSCCVLFLIYLLAFILRLRYSILLSFIHFISSVQLISVLPCSVASGLRVHWKACTGCGAVNNKLCLRVYVCACACTYPYPNPSSYELCHNSR